MSRSRRKSPFRGYTCAESEKKDKQLAHRKFRATEKDCVHKGKTLPRRMKEVSEVYCFDKDGKCRYTKDSPYYKKMMRK